MVNRDLKQKVGVKLRDKEPDSQSFTTFVRADKCMQTCTTVKMDIRKCNKCLQMLKVAAIAAGR